MIYKNKPEKFNPRFEAAGCFIQYEGEILLLKRQGYKPEGNVWGIPTGKINAGEKPLETAIREIREETSLSIPEEKMNYYRTIYVKYPTYDFVYHMFYTKLDSNPDIRINPLEHKSFTWRTLKKALNLPLVMDLNGCIKLFKHFSSLKKPQIQVKFRKT